MIPPFQASVRGRRGSAAAALLLLDMGLAKAGPKGWKGFVWPAVPGRYEVLLPEGRLIRIGRFRRWLLPAAMEAPTACPRGGP